MPQSQPAPTLPIETLSQILTYLDLEDQLSASRACSLWQNIIISIRSIRKHRYRDSAWTANGYETPFLVHGLFSKPSSLSCTFKGDQLVGLIHCRNNPGKHIRYLSDDEIKENNCAPTDMMGSPFLNESVMFIPDIERDLPPDDDEDGDEKAEIIKYDEKEIIKNKNDQEEDNEAEESDGEEDDSNNGDDYDDDDDSYCNEYKDKDGYTCYCDACAALSLLREDDEPQIGMYYKLTYPGEEAPKSVNELPRDRYRPSKTVALKAHNLNVADVINKMARWTKRGSKKEETDSSSAEAEGENYLYLYFRNR
ncbi:hypothetical protein TWF481_006910 [Arthrobotrys musiformis]|uniref:F-box domain-containing protein n=1 Tax=Arthrobotrys musiformis TaxID=47236 RepID=A0AAV9WFL8_9PEZI